MRFLLLALILSACSPGASSEEGSKAQHDKAPRPDFVGRAACAECHELQDQLYQGSHHDLAMDLPTPETVLGDFDDATHDHYGVRTAFSRDGDKYIVETEGPDGTPTRYEVAYVFGVEPLQQYLIAFPGGRVQSLGVAWDSRPEEDGGQRWYHLYEEPIPAGDVLHWTGRHQNWNTMCARCHSTGLERGYDPETRRYDTTWHEIDVSCEACHGPGSAHVAWAKDKDPSTKDYGLTALLKDPSGGQWAIDPETGNAKRSAPRESQMESETCARCHSRRQTLREAPVDGTSFHDQYRLSLLEPLLYHVDGQIQDEVYVYGSFLQSKMHGEGVTCTDCHEPHSAQLHFEGNALCARCHEPARYDQVEHHHHPAGGEGAQCVDCHMPHKTYMGVDDRRDHSLRVPRPDLSVTLGTPNACNQCHGDQDAQWAADLVAQWFPGGRQTQPHYGQAFHAALYGRPQAEALLGTVANDPEQPAIVRASAITALPGFTLPTSAQAVIEGLDSADPLVRFAAVSRFDDLAPTFQARGPAVALLEDPILLVRAEAARVLAEVTDLPAPHQPAFDAAMSDFVDSQMATADRPESHLNLGVLRMRRGRLIDAERSFREALAIDPDYLGGIINLADVLRARKKDKDAEKVLADALQRAPNNAHLLNAMGLNYARQDRDEEAILYLRRAAEADPSNVQFTFVYAVALNSNGHADVAITVLEDANRRFPGNDRILQALATFHRDKQQYGEALAYAQVLLSLMPEDQGAQRLVEELRARLEGR